MKFCKIAPEVNGKPSKLWNDLMNLIGDRENVKKLYFPFTTEAFKEQYADKLLFDENGEPTIESVISFINLDKTQSAKKKMETYEEELNFNIPSSNISVLERVVEFNDRNTGFFARIKDINQQYSKIEVLPSSQELQLEAQAMKENLNIYRKIDNFLKLLGIEIKILDPVYFNGENALFIPNAYSDFTDSIFGMFNIANNYAGIKTISEEFGHFIVECLDNNPIVQRAIKYFNENEDEARSILGDQYDNVFKYYNDKNRPESVGREILGRLLAEQINTGKVDIPQTNNAFKSLLTRAIDKCISRVKNLFKTNKNTVSEIDNIRAALNKFANDLLNDKDELEERIESLKYSKNIMAHTKEQLDSFMRAEFHFDENLRKYIKIYQKSTNNADIYNDVVRAYNKSQTETVSNQREKYKQYLESIKDKDSQETFDFSVVANIQYMANMTSESVPILEKIANDITSISLQTSSFDYKSLIQHSHKLIELRDLIYSYRQMYDDFIAQCITFLSQPDLDPQMKNAFEVLRSNLTDLSRALGDSENQMRTFSRQLVISFYRPIFGKNVTDDNIIRVKGGLNDEKIINLTEIIDIAHGDINIMQRMLEASYNSTDYFVQLVGLAIRKMQGQVRQAAQDEIELLERMKLRLNGDDQFIYERDDDGKVTNYYVNPFGFNYGKWKKYLDKETNGMSGEEKSQWFAKNARPVKIYNYTKNFDTNEWIKSSTSDNFWIPKNVNDPRWKDDTYSRLSERQKQFLDEYMEMKIKMDSLIGYTGHYKCIQRMVGSMMETKMAGSDETSKTLLGVIKNKLNLNAEDNATMGEFSEDNITNKINNKDLGFFKKLKQQIFNPSSKDETVRMQTRFNGDLYKKVPKRYIDDIEELAKLSLSSMDNMSEYICMAYNYAGMHEIADMMELTKDVAKLRKVRKQHRGVDVKDQSGSYIELSAEGTNFLAEIENLINMHVYGEYKEKGGTVAGISLTKLSDAVLRATTFTMLGYNPFTAINNVNVGKFQRIIESSFGKQNFTYKEWKQAELIYFKYLKDYVAEMNSPYKTNLLSVIEKEFNLQMQWKANQQNKEYYKNPYVKAMESLNPSFGMEMGEHYLKLTTGIAMLIHEKVKDENKNEVSLWNLLSVKVVNEVGELEINNGKRVYNSDDTEFSTRSKNIHERNDIQRISDKISIVQHRLDGIYNMEDQVELKKYWYGRWIMLFRNFMWPYLEKRWKGVMREFYKMAYNKGGGGETYNFTNETWETGMYATFIRFMFESHLDREAGKIMALPRFKHTYELMNAEQKANVIRTLVELASTLLIQMALWTVLRRRDDDENEWVTRSCNYFAHRLIQELTFGWNPNNLIQILQSPTPVMGLYDKLRRIMISIGDDRILQSGQYKGHTRLYANTMRALPVYTNMKDFIELGTSDKRLKVFDSQFWTSGAN